MALSLPAFAHRVTVFGSTRNIDATSAGVSSGSGSCVRDAIGSPPVSPTTSGVPPVDAHPIVRLVPDVRHGPNGRTGPHGRMMNARFIRISRNKSVTALEQLDGPPAINEMLIRAGGGLGVA